MAHYRAYLVGRDGNFIKAVDLDCVDGAAAKKSPSEWLTVTTSSFGSMPAELQSLKANENSRMTGRIAHSFSSQSSSCAVLI